MPTATILAGVPANNPTLYHAIRFHVGDPAALIILPDGSRTLIVRDIELHRARRHARADACLSPADALGDNGAISGDRETATAQAAAAFLASRHVARVSTDRTLPFIFAHHLRQAGVTLDYDERLGVMERRAKDDGEVEALRAAQRITEEVMEWACHRVARASARADGVLMEDGEPLSFERLDAEIDVYLLKRGHTTPGNIIACGREGADCHNRGSGPLRTGEPVIIDIFPRSKESRYNGDCTRTVVHGEAPPEIARMHAAVVNAKAAGIAAVRAGATGQDAYRAAIGEIGKAGFQRALLPENPPPGFCSMQHGLGHGVGLEVHEPPLLDEGGPTLVEGDCVTVEPGLYHATFGGVRVEDMVVVRQGGCENLNTLHEGLDWK